MSKWIAEFELEDGDTMPERMDLDYKGAKIDFHCRPMWIPCSERMPEGDGMYYVTIKDSAGEVDAVPCIWYDKKWAIGGVEVIAWIAIPKPYGAERKIKE